MRGVLSALAASLGWGLGKALASPLLRPTGQSGPLPPECSDTDESAAADLIEAGRELCVENGVADR